MQLFVLKKKTNKKGMLNPISYCFYILASVHILAEKNFQFSWEKKEEDSMREEV